MKVLIVDDEELVRKSLERVFLLRDHSVKTADNGSAGLNIWLEWHPDLVFLDVLMPKLTGVEVLERVPANDRAKVVLMSAFTGTRQTQVERVDLFLMKPFNDIFDIVQKGEGLCDGSQKTGSS